eukprot:TRINITY_DN69635_c0_g1_i1.p1 TRINITY_DN69635_c0_g1~~TRINITY_DN69635_c0_g1_i1.p1  ORF type:complete len:223 (+),score=19.28 TRINITY_DN69635_c0_g1_i1:56-724(+)
MDGVCCAVCSLQNPARMQYLVDQGHVTKTEAVKAILACFIRALLATGRIGPRYGCGSGDPCDNLAANAILREHLPKASRGLDQLSGRDTYTPQKFANLSEPYLEYVLENKPDHFEEISQKVNNGMLENFRLDAKGKFSECLTCDFDGYERNGGNDDGLFLKILDRPGSGNLWFTAEQVEDELDIFGNCCMLFKSGAGVHLEGEDIVPERLPTYYVFQWARVD